LGIFHRGDSQWGGEKLGESGNVPRSHCDPKGEVNQSGTEAAPGLGGPLGSQARPPEWGGASCFPELEFLRRFVRNWLRSGVDSASHQSTAGESVGSDGRPKPTFVGPFLCVTERLGATDRGHFGPSAFLDAIRWAGTYCQGGGRARSLVSSMGGHSGMDPRSAPRKDGAFRWDVKNPLAKSRPKKLTPRNKRPTPFIFKKKPERPGRKSSEQSGVMNEGSVYSIDGSPVIFAAGELADSFCLPSNAGSGSGSGGGPQKRLRIKKQILLTRKGPTPSKYTSIWDPGRPGPIVRQCSKIAFRRGAGGGTVVDTAPRGRGAYLKGIQGGSKPGGIGRCLGLSIRGHGSNIQTPRGSEFVVTRSAAGDQPGFLRGPPLRGLSRGTLSMVAGVIGGGAFRPEVASGLELQGELGNYLGFSKKRGKIFRGGREAAGRRHTGPGQQGRFWPARRFHDREKRPPREVGSAGKTNADGRVKYPTESVVKPNFPARNSGSIDNRGGLELHQQGPSLRDKGISVRFGKVRVSYYTTAGGTFMGRPAALRKARSSISSWGSTVTRPVPRGRLLSGAKGR